MGKAMRDGELVAAKPIPGLYPAPTSHRRLIEWVATIAALMHPTHTLLAVVVCLIVIAGIAAGLFVRTRLPDPPQTRNEHR